MSYLASQRKKAERIRHNACEADPGGGTLFGSPYPFVLRHPERNLRRTIRAPLIKYFSKQNICFWGQNKTQNNHKAPNGHMLSSQIACLNHLFPLHRNPRQATRLLRGLDPNIVTALPVEINDNPENAGYVEFECVGQENHLGEPARTMRGANCTSLDAVMKGRTRDGAVILFAFEWKYTEEYRGEKSKLVRSPAWLAKRRYFTLLESAESPFTTAFEDEATRRWLFTDPYYQLLRQTLLLCQMTAGREGGATEYRHIHVIPAQNRLLRENCPKHPLTGSGNLLDCWRGILRQPRLYRLSTPEALLFPLRTDDADDADAEWLDYLVGHYW